jgi:hypothetical protein
VIAIGKELALTLACASITCLACGAEQPHPAAQQAQVARLGTPKVSASYGTSAETRYAHIEVKNGKLRYTYNKRNSLLKPGQMIIGQHPHYTKADMVTEEAALSAAELKDLADLIRSSGFVKLKDKYDDKPGYRSYPETVTASLNGNRKQVVLYHGKPPKAFTDVGGRLFALVNKKLKKTLPSP